MSHFPIRHELELGLAERWPLREWGETHVVLGVSGGPDSVALLCAMTSLKKTFGGGGKLYVGHLNHGLRGRAADEDEVWLESLCGQLGISREVGRADVAAMVDARGDGWEEAARTARYDFLLQLAERLGARFVVTAHTADDQVETVLHRILRGTGLAGLCGMPNSRALSSSVALVRPLLSARRSDVLDYLAAIGQDYRTDETNEDSRWTRNRLRNELLPHLRQQFNPKVDEVLIRLAAQAQEAQQLINDATNKVAQEYVRIDGSRVQIDCNLLTEQPLIVVREICKVAWKSAGWPEQSMGFDQWELLASLAGEVGSSGLLSKDSAPKKVVNLPGGVRAFRDGPLLILDRS